MSQASLIEQIFPSPIDGVEGQVTAEDYLQIQQFLYREARFLDEHRFDDWLAMLSEDIHYWAPGIQTRFKRDKSPRYDPNRMAHFDDSMRDLKTRIARHKQPTAWGEDPPTRHNHVVSNIEVELTGTPDTWLVHSMLIAVKNRNDDEEDWLTARRKDQIVRRDGELKIEKRFIFLSQTVLLSKNVNTFF